VTVTSAVVKQTILAQHTSSLDPALARHTSSTAALIVSAARCLAASAAARTAAAPPSAPSGTSSGATASASVPKLASAAFGWFMKAKWSPEPTHLAKRASYLSVPSREVAARRSTRRRETAATATGGMGQRGAATRLARQQT